MIDPAVITATIDRSAHTILVVDDNPATLYATPDAIRAAVQAALDGYAAGNGGSRDGHVFNLGHGMSPDMDPERVAVLVEAVHAGSRDRTP